MNVSSALNSLQDSGFKITKARKFILRIFSKRKKPINAINLLHLLHKKGLEVNKTTVYREINFLLEQGLIHEVYIDPKKVYYESTGLKHHHHLVCNNCRKIEDVVLEQDLSDTELRIEKQKGFKVENHSLEFFGLCFNCQ